MGLVFLGFLAAAVLGGMIYVFLSRKSSKLLKLAALIALIMSGLTLGICTIILFGGSSGGKEADPIFTVLTEPEQPVKAANPVGLVFFLVLLLAFFGFIVFIGMKDQKKKAMDEAISHVNDSDLEEM
jgi:amino acid transporter